MPANVTIPVKEMTSFDLPKVCVLTGSRENVSFQKVRFQWYPRWVGAFFIAPLIGIILMLILMKRANGELPFSETGWSQYKRAKWILVVAILGCIALLIGGVAALDASGALGGLLLLMALALPIAASILFVRGKTVGVMKIDDLGITLRVPSSDAAVGIADHLKGSVGRARMPAGQVARAAT